MAKLQTTPSKFKFCTKRKQRWGWFVTLYVMMTCLFCCVVCGVATGSGMGRFPSGILEQHGP